MEPGTFCCSGNNDGGCLGSYSSRSYNRLAAYNFPVSRSKDSIWIQLWRKIKKQKNKVAKGSSSMRFTYDPYSYAQNFDQGLMWVDADDLARSFSARFAIPSRIFEQNAIRV